MKYEIYLNGIRTTDSIGALCGGGKCKFLDQYIICCNGGGVELILDVIKADNRSYLECCFIT